MAEESNNTATEAAPEPAEAPKTIERTDDEVGGDAFLRAAKTMGWKVPGPEKPAPESEEEGGEGEEAPPDSGDGGEPPPAAARRRTVDVKPDETALKELAKKLGYEVDGKTLKVAEVAGWRRKKARDQAALREQQQKLADEGNRIRSEALNDIRTARAIIQARQNGDWDEYARLTNPNGPEGDWSSLNEEVAGKLADPSYQKVRELERWKANQERQAEEQRRQYELQQARAEQQRQTQQYLHGLTENMKKSQDTLVATMAEDPFFQQAIFRVQQEHFDGSETVSPEEAARMPANGVGPSVEQELRGLYEKLQKAFGKPAESEEPAKKGNGKPAPAKKPAAAKAPEPEVEEEPEKGTPPKPSGVWGNDADATASAIRRLREAALAEEAEIAARRAGRS